MTFAAQRDQVVRVQRDLWVVDVVRSQFSDVVHFLGWCVLTFSQAVLAQPSVSRHHVIPHPLPRFGFVKGSGEVSHVLVSLFV